MSTRKTILASSLAALIGAGALVVAPAANATFGIGLQWSVAAYPDSTSDNAAASTPDGQSFCALCHTSDGGGGLNPYGNAIRSVLPNSPNNAEIVQAFRDVEGLNSDADPTGASNIAEINFGSQPGWREGQTVPTSLTGDPLDPTAVAPDIAVSPPAINFGDVLVGTTVTGTEVTIANNGDEILTVDSLTFTGDPVFALGQNTPNTPFEVAPNAAATVGVTYTPDGVGLDTGALEIASDDPDSPVVSVELQGNGVASTEACAPSVSPTELAFGQVLVGASLELPVTLTNNGVGTCTVDVSVPQCIDGEFALTSAAALSLGSGESSIITVAYTPINLGADQCRIDVATEEDGTLTVSMDGEGVDVLPTNLNIKQFKASTNVSLTRGSGIVSLDIAIENVGTEDGPGTLTVTGLQNGVEFVHQTLQVRDPVGGGATRISLQSYIPTAAGEILWTATLQDGDPDIDEATATTNVRP